MSKIRTSDKLRCRQCIALPYNKGIMYYRTTGHYPNIIGRGNTVKAAMLSFDCKVKRVLFSVIDTNNHTV